MSKICPLFSGSTGNSTYIECETGSILIDAGASARALENAVTAVHGSFSKLLMIAITHEHTDHIKGLKRLLSKTGAIVAASQSTLSSLYKLELIPSETDTVTLDSNYYELGGFRVQRFPTSHDCEGSSGYSLYLPDGKKVSVCTDLGIVTDEVRSAITGSDAVLMESNYDTEMLKSGPYPNTLKIRIMSDTGHISNSVCAAEIVKLYKSGTKRFILGHLSQNNNSIELAKACSEAALMDIGAQNERDYVLRVANPNNNRVMII